MERELSLPSPDGSVTDSQALKLTLDVSVGLAPRLLLLDVSDWHAFRHHVASPGTRLLALRPLLCLVSCRVRRPTCGDQSAPASAEEHSGAVPGRRSESRAGKDSEYFRTGRLGAHTLAGAP
uniref:Uncharacterized protein n=1 Tax=Myotis myotis TaxID=51298 RepID=A0A7J7SRT5_MYOMY|nr:hypothetical protein mMyoMyo1_009331 [Myotis myotis]